MLAKKYRLTKEKDFKNIFNAGKSCYTKIFSIKILPNQLGFNRYGIVVSSKISKKAVIRNRIKRQISQAIKKLDLSLLPGYDLVVAARPGAILNQGPSLADELYDILKKQKFLR